MVILKKLITFFVLLTSLAAWGEVSEVQVVCTVSTTCGELGKRAEALLVGKASREDIEKAIEFLLLDQSVDRLSYQILSDNNSSWLVRLNVVPKLKIITLEFDVKGADLDVSSIQTILPYKEGGFYEADLAPDSKKLVKDYLFERGYQKSKIEVVTTPVEDGINLAIKIETGEGIKVDEVSVDIDLPSLRKNVEDGFASLRGLNWNVAEARKTSEQLEQFFYNKGFWSSDVNATLQQTEEKNTLIVKVRLGDQYLFSFRGNSTFSRAELINKIKEKVKSASLIRFDEIVKESIEELYDSVGLYKVKIIQNIVLAKDKFGIARKEIHVDISEMDKTSLGNLKIEGNQFINDKEFSEFVDDKCSVLVCRGYYDRKFFNDFSELLRKKYLSNGFVMANVTSPEVRDTSSGEVDVRYVAIENQQVEITRIELPGVPAELVPKILEKMVNKQGKPLDVTNIENDMNVALETLREEGYFFARLAQIRDAKVVRYGRSFQSAQVVIAFETGKRTYFDGLLVTGNNKTKTVVIEREVELKKGDLVTSTEINRLRDRLVGLGLFGNVTITPFLTQSSKEDQYWLSLLVEVVERDFGLGEIAPGYRTDLGPKTSFQLSYNNWQGKNRTITFRTQANIRLDSDEFDSRRSMEDRRLLEFGTELSYREPWLFHTFLGSKYEFEFSTSFKRQRFFGFDADIFRVGPRLTKQFGNFTASVRYQFEDIRQFDATEVKDDDRFQIGGITPSLSYDLRDNPIIPTKGAFFGLSWEFANKYFGSQTKENLEINFSKLTSRNRFYYPIGNLVLALSVSAGYQRNFADDYQRDSSGNILTGPDGAPLTVGYIPSIKVFRLDGVDNVRGFGDGEINRLPLGIDIGELRISDTVTFINYKFEPRYYFSDLIAVGVFFDAGGLYVNQFVPFKVRTAVGVSAKLVTPVGSLDFDYGVKLNRRRYASGQRESFGRFHLSIGSF